MKTVFITSFEGIETKNVLRTPIFSTLFSELDLRIVIFTKDAARVEYHKKEFNDPKIFYEIAEDFRIKGLDRFFQWLKFTMLNTESTRLRRWMRYKSGGSFFQYYGGLFLSYVLGRKYFIKSARYLDYLLVKNNHYDKYFEKYKPDLAFLANIFYEPEIHFLRAAKKYNTKSIGFINSWDKTTARCILRLLADKFVVLNSTVKKELVDLNYVNPRNIFVGGVPQYDDYFVGKRKSREEFFREIGFDSKNKLILYAPIGLAFSGADWEMIDLLRKLKSEGKFGEGVEFLVRFHPYDKPSADEIKKRPGLIFEHPGKVFTGKQGEAWDWDMSFDELWHLGDTLYHSSLLISYASSISIDAAIFDKPIININFEILKNLPMLKSATQFYKMSHYKKALQTGAIKLVSNENELAEWVRRYLENPSIDRENRKKLVEFQCQFTDGKSGERIGKFVLQNMI